MSLVLKQQMLVPLVQLDGIQVERDVLLAQQFMQNVHHAPQQPKHALVVSVVII